jgi:DNA-binding NarL/FixJ family response regulator
MTLDPPPSSNAGAAAPGVLRVAIFDDVVAARAEQFHIPGLAVDVFAHADDAASACAGAAFDIVFMDFALGSGHKAGDLATRELRAAGFRGKVIAISSDPAANQLMVAAGADESLAKKAHLRSYMVHLGAQHLGRSEP